MTVVELSGKYMLNVALLYNIYGFIDNDMLNLDVYSKINTME